MTARLTEVTGREARSGTGDALDALIDFYAAFNARDIDGLAANWEQGDAPSMDNPMGGIRRGWKSISEGYMKLFGGPGIVQVTFRDFSSQGGDDWHRTRIAASDCPRITAKFLAEELRELGQQRFSEEYGLLFRDNEEAVFPHAIIENAFSQDVAPLWQ